jgi:hypothetical protein
MMDILIKSFNRPWYLERCIHSLYRYVSGDFRIVVLDDGTPPVYLDRIRTLFPDIQIRLSPAYAQKVEALAQHLNGARNYDAYQIPVAMWRASVEQATPYFLMFEDDIWFDRPLQLDALQQSMDTAGMVVAKLGWSGNPNTNQGNKAVVSDILEQIIPALPMNNVSLMRLLAKNTFKSRSIAFRLGLIDDKFNLPYYAMYAVAAAVFSKDFWLYLWKDAASEINESLQLANALAWKKLYPSYNYGKTRQEYCKTSYISSATNRMPGVDFDMIACNHYLNQAWLSGTLDAMENFPADFNIPGLKTVLLHANDPRCSPDNLNRWINEFKAQYIKMGCDVE